MICLVHVHYVVLMSVLKAHKSLCYLLLNMPTLNKAYCIVLYCCSFIVCLAGMAVEL